MATKLDLKDRKILYQLDINSRQPNSEIAKRVGLSKQVVGFRVARFVEQKLLLKFYTVIDISKLGFSVHKNFVRLQNLDSEKEKEFVNYLKNHPNVVWVASCDGKYDLAFAIWSKNMEHLDAILKEIDKSFGEYISERQITPIIRGEYFIRDYLLEKQKTQTQRKSFFASVGEQIKIDTKDWKILFELGKDARATSVSISNSVGISPDAVADRIRKMERLGLIMQYNIVPNESTFPYLHYKVLVGLRNMSAEKEQVLIQYCKSNTNIVYVVKTLGPWEFEVDIEVESAQKFREIMMDLKTKFKDIIQDYSALNIYQVHKYNFCPSVQI
ncbi:MAG: Lrp/AsnC family transcriptional regulator [Candidatus Aenigmarchaeota archaeon]|nr:Lrp/AsnC family transcriptional regulator [Candidatus Aenigmarchaeota archaeon]